jgi:hypothetical protein
LNLKAFFLFNVQKSSDNVEMARNIERGGQIEMENQIHETNEQKASGNSSAQVNRVFTDAYALETAEQVLSNIERIQLKISPKSYDLKKINALLDEYKAVQNEDNADALQIEFRLLQELQFWRSALSHRDEAVKTFHLRRFYDENASFVTAQTLAALGCFYRSLMPTFEVRSKYDFVVTQLFSSKSLNEPRFVRISVEELIERLKQFNVAWTGIEIDWADERARRARKEAVAVFDALRGEVSNFNRLEDLLKSKFFNRVRRHKQYLGETLFAPEVTAASIQCNVEVGNKFSQLVAEENESFRYSLESEHGGVDVLNLILEENPAHSVNLLKKINPDYQNSAESESENPEANGIAHNAKSDAEIQQQFEVQANPTAHKSGKLEIVPPTRSFSSENNSNSESLIDKTESEGDENEDFLRVLSQINRREPDGNMLREYLNSSMSPEVRSFDFSIYLNEVSESAPTENELKRRALRLIFVAEDYQRRLQNEPESVLSEEEIKSLKKEIQTVINDLRAAGNSLIGGNRKERGQILLTAVNNLFEVLLRFNTAYTGFLNSQKERGNNEELAGEKVSGNAGKEGLHKKENINEETKKEDVSNKDETVVEPESVRADAEPKPFEAKSNKSGKVSRVLIAATVVIMLFGAGYFSFSYVSEPLTAQIGQASDIKDIDFKSLKGGERLLVARISNNTLIGVVSDAWQKEIIENKRAALQSLLGQGTQYHYKTVLLFNSKGEIIGNATGREITAK